MRYILYAILAWFIYNLLFRLIIPVFKTTRQMKKKFRGMQEEQMKQHEPYQQADKKKTTSKPRSEDYIDFEEIK
jgi:Sec-independent protein translocase protein TatA